MPDFVDAISSYNRDFLRPYGGDSETPVHVIHCGIELDRYVYRPRRAPKDGSDLRPLRGEPPRAQGPPAFCSRRSRRRTETASRIHLTLIGDGPERRPPGGAGARAGNRRAGRLRRCLSPRTRSEGAWTRRTSSSSRAWSHAMARWRDCRLRSWSRLPAGCRLSHRASRASRRSSGMAETGYLAEAGDPASLRTAIANACEGKLDAAAARQAGRRRVRHRQIGERPRCPLPHVGGR